MDDDEIIELRPMSEAPKGGGADRVDDPSWVEPPLILLRFQDDVFSVAYWDWYYAEGGCGFGEARGCDAWVDKSSGELVELHYDKPIGWYELPK